MRARVAAAAASGLCPEVLHSLSLSFPCKRSGNSDGFILHINGANALNQMGRLGRLRGSSFVSYAPLFYVVNALYREAPHRLGVVRLELCVYECCMSVNTYKTYTHTHTHIHGGAQTLFPYVALRAIIQ